MSSWPLERVISGGQDGADQAVLRAAVVLGYQPGGMMPHGWKTESGTRPEFRELYQMTESRFSGYEHRTRFNVRVSDGTLIFARTNGRGVIAETGSALTEAVALSLKRPHLVIDPWAMPSPAYVREWIVTHQIRVLNGAGNRESKAPGIGALVEAYLVKALVPF